MIQLVKNSCWKIFARHFVHWRKRIYRDYI